MTYEELLDKWIRKLGRPCTAGEIVHDLRQLEQPEPVKHGHWINKTECSICGEWEDFQDGYRPYCPNCGARMDKGGEDGKAD